MFQFVKLLNVTMTFGVPHTNECLYWMAKIESKIQIQIQMDGKNTMAKIPWTKYHGQNTKDKVPWPKMIR